MVVAEWAGEDARREVGLPGCDSRPSRFLFMAITVMWPCVCPQNRKVPDIGEHDSIKQHCSGSWLNGREQPGCQMASARELFLPAGCRLAGVRELREA